MNCSLVFSLSMATVAQRGSTALTAASVSTTCWRAWPSTSSSPASVLSPRRPPPQRYVMVSFYRYVGITAPHALAARWLDRWRDEFGVLGRVYVAREGVNAQLAVPEAQLAAWRRACVDDDEHLRGVVLNVDEVLLCTPPPSAAALHAAPDRERRRRAQRTVHSVNSSEHHRGSDVSGGSSGDGGGSGGGAAASPMVNAAPFRTLHVRVRAKLCNDGLDADELAWTTTIGVDDDNAGDGDDNNAGASRTSTTRSPPAAASPAEHARLLTGEHLDAPAWNAMLARDDVMCVDVRNHYESELGHFDSALCTQQASFRRSLRELAARVDARDRRAPLLLYCTGGIRCEKASSFLRARGFERVYQLRGGIVSYLRAVDDGRVAAADNRFRGFNFVFDQRLLSRADVSPHDAATADATAGAGAAGAAATNAAATATTAGAAHVVSQCHQCGEPSAAVTNCANPACDILYIQCVACAERYARTCGSDMCVEYTALDAAADDDARRALVAAFGRRRRGLDPRTGRPSANVEPPPPPHLPFARRSVNRYTECD